MTLKHPRRMFKLFKEYNVPHSKLIQFLKEKGYSVKGRKTFITDDMYRDIEERFKKEKKEAEIIRRKMKILQAPREIITPENKQVIILERLNREKEKNNKRLKNIITGLRKQVATLHTVGKVPGKQEKTLKEVDKTTELLKVSGVRRLKLSPNANEQGNDHIRKEIEDYLDAGR